MSGISIRRGLPVLVAALLPLTAGCSFMRSTVVDNPQKAYVAADDGSRLASHAPMFVLQTYGTKYNRIGSPKAESDDQGGERIDIDTKHPAVYVQEETFRAGRGEYTNLIYRVHFPEVPMPHVTAGRNVGLLAVITLDPEDQPVLITTVHTCGCYLAFVPTNFLPADARPDDWAPGRQKVHGEKLPGLMQLPKPFSTEFRPVIFLRDETHRVMDIRLQNVNEAAWRYDVVPTAVKPMASLDALPLGSATTSFFYESGLRRGYVKGAGKFFETVLMGWWAMDLRVGSDKRYANRDQTGKTFYTSLKFWERDESDMWPFADFLTYWGWHL